MHTFRPLRPACSTPRGRRGVRDRVSRTGGGSRWWGSETLADTTRGRARQGDIFHRVGRAPPRPLAFAAESTYVAPASAFVVATTRGFVEDGAWLHDMYLLDAIAPHRGAKLP